MATLNVWEEFSRQAADRRRHPRIKLAVPIQVSGLDQSGEFFTEKTTTANISETGCQFALRSAGHLSPGATLTVSIVPRDANAARISRPVLFEIAWVEPAEDGSQFVGAVKLQSEGIWELLFSVPVGRVSPVA